MARKTIAEIDAAANALLAEEGRRMLTDLEQAPRATALPELEPLEQVAPADYLTREERAAIGLPRAGVPICIYLREPADWTGGKTRVPVGPGDPWRVAPQENGLMIFRRQEHGDPGARRAYFVAWAATRFVEFTVE